jgi:predicted  nucleic acid-binding Zn-ribbon protein
VRWTKDSRILTGIAVVVMAYGLWGCSDNPQNKADRNAHQQSRQAVIAASQTPQLAIEEKEGAPPKITIVDMAAAHAQNRQRIQDALKSLKPASSAKAAASIVSGDLAWTQAVQLRLSLTRFDPPAKAVLVELDRKLRELGRLEIDREELQTHVKTTDVQAVQLEKTLTTAEGGHPALNDQLAAVTERLGKLEQQKSERTQLRDELQQKGNALQVQGEERLKKADSLSGDEKLKMQQEGYDLLLSKKQLYIEIQDRTDQIAQIDSDIAIVKPQVQTIQTQIASVQARIQAIRDSENLKTIKVQLSDTDKQLAQCKERISWLLGDLKSTQEKYSEAIKEILVVLDSGLEDYQAAGSRETADYAAARVANAQYEVAQTINQAVGFLAALLGRITAAKPLFPNDMAPTVGDMVALMEKAVAELAAKGIERCDLSFAEYEKLAGRGSKGFAADIVKEQLLTLYTKLLLAERIKKTDLVEAVNAKAKEIMDPLVQQDPTFAKTLTAELFSGSQAYNPQMAIDVELYTEGVVKQFQGWKALKGPAAEAEVNKLLALLEAMSKVESPAVMDKLKVEWDALKTAKEKGFAVDQQPADANTPAR